MVNPSSVLFLAMCSSSGVHFFTGLRGYPHFGLVSRTRFIDNWPFFFTFKAVCETDAGKYYKGHLFLFLAFSDIYCIIMTELIKSSYQLLSCIMTCAK